MAERTRRVCQAAPRRSVAVRLRLDLIVLAICTLLLALLSLERSSLEQQRRPSVYSTYDTGPNGYRALYGVSKPPAFRCNASSANSARSILPSER